MRSGVASRSGNTSFKASRIRAWFGPGRATRRRASCRPSDVLIKMSPILISRSSRQNHLRRHPSGFGRRSGTAQIGLSDLGHQPGPLGEMVQGLPERVRQNTDENMSSRAPAVMMPDRPQEKLALEDSEGAFNDRELNIRFPEFGGRPARLVAS